MIGAAVQNWYQNELLWVMTAMIAIMTGSRWLPWSLVRPVPRRPTVILPRRRTASGEEVKNPSQEEQAEMRRREEEWSKPHRIAADKYLLPTVATLLIAGTLGGGLIFPGGGGLVWGVMAAVAWRLVLRRLENRLADKP